MENRDEILRFSDEELSAHCRLEFFKRTGNGGQKRNKTSSAVRCTLTGTEYSAEDCSERSQNRNRAAALRKLRKKIALAERVEPAVPPEHPDCSLTHPEYPLTLAHWLDMLSECGGDYRRAAERLSMTPSAFLKKLARDPELWQKLHQEQLLPRHGRPDRIPESAE